MSYDSFWVRNNENSASIMTINTWFENANKVDDNYFTKFMSLWVSFNCYYESEHYETVKGNSRRDPSDRAYINYISTSKKYKQVYFDLLEDHSFLLKIERMIEVLQTETRFDGCIANMHQSKRYNEEYAVEFRDPRDFKQFINVIYQVRCNVFHGSKCLADQRDQRIVKNFFEAFSQFCERIYYLRRYI